VVTVMRLTRTKHAWSRFLVNLLTGISRAGGRTPSTGVLMTLRRKYPILCWKRCGRIPTRNSSCGRRWRRAQHTGPTSWPQTASLCAATEPTTTSATRHSAITSRLTGSTQTSTPAAARPAADHAELSRTDSLVVEQILSQGTGRQCGR